jgi:hypothetical protein
MQRKLVVSEEDFCSVVVNTKPLPESVLEYWGEVVQNIIRDNVDENSNFRVSQKPRMTDKNTHIIVPIFVNKSFEITNELTKRIKLGLPEGTHIRLAKERAVKNYNVTENWELAVVIPNDGSKEISATKIYIKLLRHFMILLLVAFVTYSNYTFGFISY